MVTRGAAEATVQLAPRMPGPVLHLLSFLAVLALGGLLLYLCLLLQPLQLFFKNQQLQLEHFVPIVIVL